MNFVLILSGRVVKLIGFFVTLALTGLVLYKVLRLVRHEFHSFPNQMLAFAGMCILLYFMFLLLIEILVEVLPSSFEAGILYILTHTTNSPALLYNSLIRPTWAAQILENLPIERAADTLKSMTVDRTVKLLSAVDPNFRMALLKLLPDVRKWIIYEQYYNIPLEKRGGITLTEFERQAERNQDMYQ